MFRRKRECVLSSVKYFCMTSTAAEDNNTAIAWINGDRLKELDFVHGVLLLCGRPTWNNNKVLKSMR